MKINSKLLTVVIPAYNASLTIRQTLDSLLAQRDVEFEIIVSDNHSTDNTAEIVRSYSDPRINLVTCPVPTLCSGDDLLSISFSAITHFNTLFDYGCGELICFYHADDLYYPEILNRESAFLQRNPEVGAVFTLGNIINEEGDLVVSSSRRLPKSNQPFEIFDFSTLFETILINGSFIMTPTLMIRRSILKKVGILNIAFEQAADYDFWLRVANEAPIGVIQEKLFSRRISTRQDSYRGRSIYRLRPFPIFKVYDYFLTNTDIAQKITQEAIQSLNISRIIDQLRIARNLFIDGRVIEAKYKIRLALFDGNFKPIKQIDSIYFWSGRILWACSQIGLGRSMAHLQNHIIGLYKLWRMRIK